MTNPTQRDYPDEIENGPARRDQLDEEFVAPQDQTGLAGSPQSPDDSGLVGTPDSPDNTGLVGSTGAPGIDQTAAGGTLYGNDTGYTGNYGSGSGGPGLSGRTRTPESELLDPGYNPRIGNAGRLDDLNRTGQPGTPNYDPDNPSVPGRPIPSGYSGAPNSPGIPNQAGTQDQTTYSSQSGATPPQDEDGGNTVPNQP